MKVLLWSLLAGVVLAFVAVWAMARVGAMADADMPNPVGPPRNTKPPRVPR